MVKNVVNEIVLGIAAKVKAIYKDKGDYPIYTDNEEQGLEKPCFFIKVLNGEESREIGLVSKFYKDLLNIVIIGRLRMTHIERAKSGQRKNAHRHFRFHFVFLHSFKSVHCRNRLSCNGFTFLVSKSNDYMLKQFQLD